jgi:hypothetical protein
VTACSPFGLTVEAEDSSGNLITSFNGTVTMVLTNYPGAATLGGTLTATASGGLATFSGLWKDSSRSRQYSSKREGAATNASERFGPLGQCFTERRRHTAELTLTPERWILSVCHPRAAVANAMNRGSTVGSRPQSFLIHNRPHPS